LPPVIASTISHKQQPQQVEADIVGTTAAMLDAPLGSSRNIRPVQLESPHVSVRRLKFDTPRSATGNAKDNHAALPSRQNG
jgi:hypothetical protein